MIQEKVVAATHHVNKCGPQSLAQARKSRPEVTSELVMHKLAKATAGGVIYIQQDY